MWFVQLLLLLLGLIPALAGFAATLIAPARRWVIGQYHKICAKVETSRATRGGLIVAAAVVAVLVIAELVIIIRLIRLKKQERAAKAAAEAEKLPDDDSPVEYV